MRARIAALAAGAIMLSGAAEAREATTEPVDPDLRCAIWAAVAGGELEQGPQRASYDAVFTYFMGRLEGRTGARIENAMTPERIVSETQDWEAATRTCQPRALELGERLIAFGASLQGQAGEEAPQTEQEPATSAP